jgi:hypothetical protein
MKKFILFHLLIAFGIFSYAQNQNLLSGKFTREQLSGILIPQSKWTPFPKITDRAGWGKADQEMMKSFVAEAEKYINYSWPSIPATKSLLIERTGNRSEFEAISFEKRQVLGTLLLGEFMRIKVGSSILSSMECIPFVKKHGGVHPHTCRRTKIFPG